MLDDCRQFARKYPNFVLGVIGTMLMAPFSFLANLGIGGLLIDTTREFEYFFGGTFVMFFLGTMLIVIAFLRALHRRRHPDLYPTQRSSPD